MNRMRRQDIVEKRQKCVVCGYELTTPEYINDDKCCFHSDKQPAMGLVAWIRFSLAEYRVMRLKRKMARRGLTAHDYMACVGRFGEDIGCIKDEDTFERLVRELTSYMVKNG